MWAKHLGSAKQAMSLLFILFKGSGLLALHTHEQQSPPP